MPVQVIVFGFTFHGEAMYHTLAIMFVFVYFNVQAQDNKYVRQEKHGCEGKFHFSTTHLSIVLALPSEDMLTPILTISRPSYFVNF